MRSISDFSLFYLGYVFSMHVGLITVLEDRLFNSGTYYYWHLPLLVLDNLRSYVHMVYLVNMLDVFDIRGFYIGVLEGI